MTENNPLRQYFRRPALYLKLPSGGKFYPAGSINLPDNGEIPIYPMTAIDEITTKTPDSLYNGVAVVEIIKSCAPNIKDPWVMPSVDLDTVLAAIRVASNDKGLEINSVCPNCSATNSYDINLGALLATIKLGDYSEPLTQGDLKIVFKPLTYRDVNTVSLTQNELQRQVINSTDIKDEELKMAESAKILNKLNELTFNVVANCIDSIITPGTTVNDKEFIIDYLKNCSRTVFEDIRKKTISLREPSEIQPIPVKCAECSHEYKQSISLNVSDFFE